jgi:hypothetical protein
MKKMMSFVAMSALFAACGGSPVRPSAPAVAPSPTPSPVTYSVAGTVSEATQDGSRPVADASVSVGNGASNLTASTDESGKFSVEGLTAGTWELSIGKEGYEPLTMMLEVQASKTIEIELKPAPIE